MMTTYLTDIGFLYAYLSLEIFSSHSFDLGQL